MELKPSCKHCSLYCHFEHRFFAAERAAAEVLLLVCTKEKPPGCDLVRVRETLVSKRCLMYLNPKSMYTNSPKPMIIAIKAIILHTFGV